MTLWRLTYTLILALATPLIVLRLAWRARKQPAYLRNVGERFGLYGPKPAGAVIWLHVVSVGETRAAEPLVRALESAYPRHRILLTHMTPTGRETSEQLFRDRVLRCYLPYDLPPCVGAFLRHFQPQLGVLMETELWPNLIQACRARDVPLYLVNARLSERSAQGYGRVAGLTREVLQSLRGIGAQTQADAQRLEQLGARDVVITGNLKFDRGPQTDDLELGGRLRQQFGPTRPVMLAASTREGEEELVLDAVAALPPETLIVIVPRHPQRFDEVAGLLQRRGMPFQRRSENGAVAAQTRVLLGDSSGELFAYYAACDVAFIGGSLLPLGGQNLLEACAVGKPVVIGPHTFNFAEATRLAVEVGAAIQVADVTGLSETLARLLGDPAQQERMGAAARALMAQHQGATERTMALLVSRRAAHPR